MTTIQHLITAATLATLSSLTMPALAAGTVDQPAVGSVPLPQASAADMTDAEVRKVDAAQGKVTLKHGEIKSLDMPPMTMVFTVKDKAMLDGVKPGDKVKVKVANENGKLTVLEMAPAR